MAQPYNIPLLSQLSALHDGPDACLLAVADSAVANIATQLSFKSTVVLHHAGGVPLQALQPNMNIGVAWPVYSILKYDLPVHRQFPCVWEANTDRARSVALQVCQAMSGIQYEADSEQRKWLHMTAVISNNFTNYLLGMCATICKEQQLPFSLLQPILQQTIDRVNTYDPATVQTGPARRGDTATIDHHMALLQHNPYWQAVYAALSAAIKNTDSTNGDKA